MELVFIILAYFFHFLFIIMQSIIFLWWVILYWFLNLTDKPIKIRIPKLYIQLKNRDSKKVKKVEKYWTILLNILIVLLLSMLFYTLMFTILW